MDLKLYFTTTSGKIWGDRTADTKEERDIYFWAYGKCLYPETAWIWNDFEGWDCSDRIKNRNIDEIPANIFNKVIDAMHELDSPIYEDTPKIKNIEEGQKFMPDGWFFSVSAARAINCKGWTGKFNYKAVHKNYYSGQAKIVRDSAQKVLNEVWQIQYQWDREDMTPRLPKNAVGEY